MNEQAKQYVEEFMAKLIAKNPNEPEFHQAVREVAESLAPHIVASPALQKMKILERIAEPERVIIFQLPCHHTHIWTIYNNITRSRTGAWVVDSVISIFYTRYNKFNTSFI